MSQWGQWADELDDTELSWLTVSYLRRLQFESRTQAVAVVNALGESMGSGNNKSGRVPASQMLAEFGVT